MISDVNSVLTLRTAFQTGRRVAELCQALNTLITLISDVNSVLTLRTAFQTGRRVAELCQALNTLITLISDVNSVLTLRTAFQTGRRVAELCQALSTLITLISDVNSVLTLRTAFQTGRRVAELCQALSTLITLISDVNSVLTLRTAFQTGRRVAELEIYLLMCKVTKNSRLFADHDIYKLLNYLHKYLEEGNMENAHNDLKDHNITTLTATNQRQGQKVTKKNQTWSSIQDKIHQEVRCGQKPGHGTPD